MDVSTRGAPPSFAGGARVAAGAAAWCLPTLAPIGIVQALVVVAPWLESLEAFNEERIAARMTDWRTRSLLEAAVVACGGVGGLLAACLLATAAWLVVLRARGPLARVHAVRADAGDHRAHAARLAAWLVGAAACLLVQAAASGLDGLVDTVTSLRPSGAVSLALVAGSQAFPLVAVGGILGATLALSRLAGRPGRGRVGALTVVSALGLAAVGAQLWAVGALASRFDVRRSLAEAVAPTEQPEAVEVIILARDRQWRLPMRDGLRGVRFTPEAAARAEALHGERRGWTMLAEDLERFVIGERLLAVEPDGARAATLRLALRRAGLTTTRGLLISLGSAAPSATARQVLDALETSPTLHLGPEGLYLVAHAHGRLGARNRAEAALARLRSHDGEKQVVRARSALPLVLSTVTTGRLEGRLLVDGNPWRRRIGLVATRDLFRFPAAGEDVPVTWLLRLVTATEPTADGRFRFDGLAEGDLALVLLLPGLHQGPVSTRPALPRLEISAAHPTVDVGEINVRLEPSPSAADGE